MNLAFSASSWSRSSYWLRKKCWFVLVYCSTACCFSSPSKPSFAPWSMSWTQGVLSALYCQCKIECFWTGFETDLFVSVVGVRFLEGSEASCTDIKFLKAYIASGLASGTSFFISFTLAVCWIRSGLRWWVIYDITRLCMASLFIGLVTTVYETIFFGSTW